MNYPPYRVNPCAVNVRPETWPLASIGECEMSLSDAESVLAKWEVFAGSVIYTEATEEDCLHLPGTVGVLEWTPGALFRLCPAEGLSFGSLLERIGGVIGGLFRFSSDTPKADRQRVAEEAFNRWKCHVALYLQNLPKEGQPQ